MNRKKEFPDDSGLRKRADRVMRGKPEIDGDLSNIISEGRKGLIYELQVHQIELKMQNEELRRIQHELEKSRDKYSHLYDFSPVGYFTLNEEGIIDEVNLTGAVMLGIERRNLIGKPFTRFIKRDDQDIFYKHRLSVLEEELPQTCELRFVKKDGSEFFSNLACTVVKESESSGYIRAALSDISEFKRTEGDLELYRDLFNQSNDAIYIIDPDTARFMDVNEKACSDLRYARPECLNLKINDIEAFFADKDSWRKYVTKMKNKGHMLAEREHRRSDGSVFPVEVSAKFIKHGEKEYIVALVRDLSEKKALESQLRHAQKMESIGTLAGGIAHEFNNILGIILGYTELSLGTIPEDSTAGEYMKEVRTASLRAKDVVHQMLSFARRSPGERKPVQIKSVIKDTLKLLRASIPSTIEIVTRLSSKSDMVMADPVQIKELLMNLCTNSEHAMREKGGKLEIKLEDAVIVEDQASSHGDLIPGNYFKLTVRDTGHGIDPEIIERIFDPYFTTRDLAKGTTGMGLAVVHGIIKANDGSIKIESEPGQGTIVEVYLPQYNIPEGESDSKEAGPKGLAGERILFIDDETQIVNLHKQLLEKNGYSVTAKTNSLEALAMFMENPQSFDVVITDMTMPDMTGDNLANEIKTIRPDIPVIMCTGYSERISGELAKKRGIDVFLMKPVTEEMLTKALKQVLR